MIIPTQWQCYFYEGSLMEGRRLIRSVQRFGNCEVTSNLKRPALSLWSIRNPWPRPDLSRSSLKIVTPLEIPFDDISSRPSRQGRPNPSSGSPVPLGKQLLDFSGLDQVRKTLIKYFFEFLAFFVVRKDKIAFEFQHRLNGVTGDINNALV